MPDVTRILIIDDDTHMRKMLRDLIELSGNFAVVEAPNGEAGVALARQLQPDLIVLDLMMPDRTGFEVCADLRQDPRTREVPVIVLSGADETQAMSQALEAGADDFLSKPCSLAELRGKICSIARLNRYRTLQYERGRFRWLLDRSLEPLLVTDVHGRLLFANARARQVFGLGEAPAGDVIAVIEQHFRSEPAGALTELRERGFRPGPAFAVVQPETALVAARWFDVEQHAAESGSGELLLKFTDRTGWVRRELETWSFQHVLSHKLRTPLNGLGNVLDLVAASPAMAQDPDAASLLQLAQENARRLEDTLLGILKYHEVLFRATSAPATKNAPVEVRLLLEAAAQEAGLSQLSMAATPGAELTTSLVAPLQLVFGEIADNYAQFSAAKESGLTVSLTPTTGGQIEVKFFAPGPVPPPEAIAQLGRPYWQLQSRWTGEIPGVGLGLATARLMLRSHGGGLEVQADPGRTGLIMTVTIPDRPDVQVPSHP